MSIFYFWEPQDNIPGYLKLCKQTWLKHLAEHEIIAVDFSNINKYIDLTPYGDSLFVKNRFSLPQIADVLRWELLYKYGGLWFDLDTIILANSAKKYFELGDHDLAFFGNRERRAVSIGVIAAKSGSDILQRWIEAARCKCKNFKIENNQWAYFGNNIINADVKELKSRIKIYDIGEEHVMPECKKGEFSTPQKYQNFWFSQNDYSSLGEGLVMLHNSWTPKSIKCLSINEFNEIDCNLSKILLNSLDQKVNRFKTRWLPYVENNNRIIVKKEDGTKVENIDIPGLTINFLGSNSTIEMEEPLGTWQNSQINIGSDCIIKIQGTKRVHFRHGLTINARATKSKCYIGKNFGCWGLQINIMDQENQTVSIGDDCLVSFGVVINLIAPCTIYDIKTKLPINWLGSCNIGNNVWIGRNVNMLMGTEIKDNVVILDNACIMHEIKESNVVLAGNPANIIYRNANWTRDNPSKYLKDLT